MRFIPFVNRYFGIGFDRNRIDIIIGNHCYFIVWGSL